MGEGAKTSSRVPAYIYVLWEHKSHPDRRVTAQILHMMVQIWSREHAFPIVLPIVVTNTPRPWSLERGLAGLFDAPEVLMEYVPTVPLVHIPLTETIDERFGQDWDLRAAVKALALTGDGKVDDRIGAAFELAARGSWARHDKRLAKALLEYVSRGKMKINQGAMVQVVRRALGRQVEDVMTNASRFDRRRNTSGDGRTDASRGGRTDTS